MTFDLDDELDRYRFALASSASGYRDTLVDLDQYLRGIVKHTEEKDWPDAYAIREKLYEFLAENSVNLHP